MRPDSEDTSIPVPVRFMARAHWDRAFGFHSRKKRHLSMFFCVCVVAEALLCNGMIIQRPCLATGMIIWRPCLSMADHLETLPFSS
jgi:hypothetical protein